MQRLNINGARATARRMANQNGCRVAIYKGMNQYLVCLDYRGAHPHFPGGRDRWAYWESVLPSERENHARPDQQN